MGEEEVYKVTLMKDAAGDEENKGEEEEEAGDMDDPFAMMGGMGEEQVYQVTLMQEKAEEDGKDVASENGKETGDDYPKISYGAPVSERLSSEKMEKKMKKIIKEG